eukprot:TRINITY_DN5487_c0_g1_i1.p1 TRINITY_DN5487_c0_g1~~TRINITY_DN5487_c0_g1_i1.p1  ORF type:complete len:734 (+),score=180.11 TRINITY_DN5487_c0_g1_i1:37-2238(+)
MFKKTVTPHQELLTSRKSLGDSLLLPNHPDGPVFDPVGIELQPTATSSRAVSIDTHSSSSRVKTTSSSVSSPLKAGGKVQVCVYDRGLNQKTLLGTLTLGAEVKLDPEHSLGDVMLHEIRSLIIANFDEDMRPKDFSFVHGGFDLPKSAEKFTRITDLRGNRILISPLSVVKLDRKSKMIEESDNSVSESVSHIPGPTRMGTRDSMDAVDEKRELRTSGMLLQKLTEIQTPSKLDNFLNKARKSAQFHSPDYASREASKDDLDISLAVQNSVAQSIFKGNSKKNLFSNSKPEKSIADALLKKGRQKILASHQYSQVGFSKEHVDDEQNFRSANSRDGIGWVPGKLPAHGEFRIEDDEFVVRLARAIERDSKDTVFVNVVNENGTLQTLDSLDRIVDYIRQQDVSSLKKADESRKSVIWVDVEGSHPATIVELGRMFGFHPLTVEDICSTQSRQKIEPFNDYLLIILKSLHHSHYFYETDNPMKIIVFQGIVFTFHHFPLFTIEVARTRFIKFLKGADFDQLEVLDLLHILFDTMTDFDGPVVQFVEKEVSELEELVYLCDTNDEISRLLQRIGLLKRQICRYRQQLLPKQDVIEHIVDQTYSAGDAENNDTKLLHLAYFRDVYDHIVADLTKLEDHAAAIAGCEGTYLAKVSITVGVSANRVSDVMKKFSSVGTILLPITYITGVFGMNVPIPYQQGGINGDFYDLTPFYCLFIGMMTFAVICGFYFKKNNWL